MTSDQNNLLTMLDCIIASMMKLKTDLIEGEGTEHEDIRFNMGGTVIILSYQLIKVCAAVFEEGFTETHDIREGTILSKIKQQFIPILDENYEETTH